MEASAASIRPAQPSEYPELTDLARRSKAHWGYGDKFLLATGAELIVSPYRPDTQSSVWVLESGGEVLGFYAMFLQGGGVMELDFLFLEPQQIGKGHGRAMIQHAKRTAAGMGCHTMVIQGDPHADRFYVAAGATQVGSRPSSAIPGQNLPLYQIDLRAVI